MSNNCQVQTPDEYAIKLLDYVGYTCNLYGKRVLENSCGTGNVLTRIVERYIKDLRKNGYKDKKIVKGIENDIIGYETDKESLNICIDKLENIRKKFDLPIIKWKIHNKDYLKSDVQQYDFIIGNPPYITYHDLKINDRKWLQENFESCKNGRCDYYYAFVEKSIRELSYNGKLAYLVPFSIFRNKYATDLRNIIKSTMDEIYDFTGVQIFPGVITSSTIIICDKSKKDTEIKYYQGDSNRLIKKDALGEKWFFVNCKNNKYRFGDYFFVCNSVATLLNQAFLISDYEQDDMFTYIGTEKIENTILKSAVSTKSLKRKKDNDKEEKIIFPYKINRNGFERYEEDEFKICFPETYNHLKKYRKKLKNRKANPKVKWFEYGRTQALNEIKGAKLVMPMVITSRVKVYRAKNMSVPYAGYFVKKVKNGKYSLFVAKKILESKDFYEYVKEHGTPTTTNSYRISVKEIENYRFDLENYK